MKRIRRQDSARSAHPRLIAASLTALLIADVVVVASDPSRGDAGTSSLTAETLAHGHWQRIATPPVRLVLDFAAVDGASMLVAQAREGQNIAAFVGRYDATTNTWTRLPAAPQPAYPATGAWIDGTPAVFTGPGGPWVLTPDGTAWHRTGRLPTLLPALKRQGVFGSVTSLMSTAGTTMATVVGPRLAATYSLNRRRDWQRLALVPDLGPGPLAAVPLIELDGTTYGWAVGATQQRGEHHGLDSTGGWVTLLRLAGDGWRLTKPVVAMPQQDVALSAVDHEILAVGSGCMGDTGCLDEIPAATLVTPGSNGGVVTLSPPGGLASNDRVVGGANAVVVTGTDGGTEIYNVTTRQWLTGPTAPVGTATTFQTYWTSEGVVLLTATGGWLLRPDS